MNDEKFTIHIEDNSELVKEALKLATEKSLMLAGTNAVRYVTEYMSKPDFTGRDIVDTGRLRASISFSTMEYQSGLNDEAVAESSPSDALTEFPQLPNSVIVGTNVDYAQAVEFGKKTDSGVMTAGRYYLSNGIQLSLPETEDGVKSIMKGESIA